MITVVQVNKRMSLIVRIASLLITLVDDYASFLV